MDLKKRITDILASRGESILNDGGVDRDACASIADAVMAEMTNRTVPTYDDDHGDPNVPVAIEVNRYIVLTLKKQEPIDLEVFIERRPVGWYVGVGNADDHAMSLYVHDDGLVSYAINSLTDCEDARPAMKTQEADATEQLRQLRMLDKLPMGAAEIGLTRRGMEYLIALFERVEAIEKEVAADEK